MAASFFLVLVTTAFAQKTADKPRVPPGLDPGGVAVAVIGGGVNYTQPEIAARLARDGEGEIIGWDFIDRDRKPYSHCGSRAEPACGDLYVEMLIVHNGKARIIPLRVDGHDPATLIAAVIFAQRSPARVVLLVVAFPEAEAFLVDAARRNPEILIVGTAGRVSRDTQHLVHPDNLIVLNQHEPNVLAEPIGRIAARIAGAAAEMLAGNPNIAAPEVKRTLSAKPEIHDERIRQPSNLRGGVLDKLMSKVPSSRP